MQNFQDTFEKRKRTFVSAFSIRMAVPLIKLKKHLQLYTGAQPETFQDRGGFAELGHFDKIFVKNTRKKGSAGKNFEAFSPRFL